MKKMFHIAMALAVLAITFHACKKEAQPSVAEEVVTSSGEVSLRSGDRWDGRDHEKIMQDIQSFREEMQRWNQGAFTGARMEAGEALDMMEVVWNFYVARPGKAFSRYELALDSIRLEQNPATWDDRQMSAVYLALKERLSAQYGRVEGTDKAFQFIDIGFGEGSAANTVYIMANIGHGEIQSTEGLSLSDIRWSMNPGYTPSAPCMGEADKIIGQAVNANLGFFLQNLPPSPINPGNPNTNPTALIFSTVQHVQTNFFGAQFPLFNSPPPLFVERLFQTTNSALLNAVNAGNQFPGYNSAGQYKVHADFSIAPANPDENCFSFQKLGAYSISSRQVGDSYVARVNQILNTSNRRLIAAFVGNNAAQSNNPGLGPVRLQEHPTYHFYARVLLLAVPEDLPFDPEEM